MAQIVVVAKKELGNDPGITEKIPLTASWRAQNFNQGNTWK